MAFAGLQGHSQESEDKMEEEKRIITGIDREKNEIRDIEKPRPSVFYKKTKCNDNDEEVTLEVVAETSDKAIEKFKELKKELKL